MPLTGGFYLRYLAIPFPGFSTAYLTGFFVDSGSLYLFDKTLILAFLLETPKHLVQRLVAPGPYLYH